MRSVVSYQARSRPRAARTHAGVPFVCWLASNGTIVANPRRQSGAIVVSFRSVDSSLPAHRRMGCCTVLWSRDHILAPVPEDLKRFVVDRLQRVHLHHVQWDWKNSAICRFPIWPAVVFSTRSTSSSSLAFKFSLLISKNINAASKPTRLFPSTNG